MGQLSAVAGPIACAVAISIGQILFRLLGLSIEERGQLVALRHGLLLGLAGLLYIGATLYWIHLLRQFPLNQIYPYMALSFVLVPAAGWVLLGETPTLTHALGTIIIVIGLAVVASA
jgi:drug/metabolite transporter (DMT)-like permease